MIDLIIHQSFIFVKGFSSFSVIFLRERHIFYKAACTVEKGDTVETFEDDTMLYIVRGAAYRGVFLEGLCLGADLGGKHHKHSESGYPDGSADRAGAVFGECTGAVAYGFDNQGDGAAGHRR